MVETEALFTVLTVLAIGLVTPGPVSYTHLRAHET